MDKFFLRMINKGGTTEGGEAKNPLDTDVLIGQGVPGKLYSPSEIIEQPADHFIDLSIATKFPDSVVGCVYLTFDQTDQLERGLREFLRARSEFDGKNHELLIRS